MAKTKLPTLPLSDPAELANKRILAAREARIKEKRKQEEQEDALDLGLKIEEPVKATDAAEFLRDEWDKKTFGEQPRFTTKVVYGPDPIVHNCPEFHERLEMHGKEAVAAAYEELVMAKGEFAAPDAVMSKSIRKSIAKFGREATAKAFRDRIMRIPERTVEVEVDNGALDPLLSNPMREAVQRYGRPGMAVKFLSDRCMDVLGRRGYEIVKDEKGAPVKIGTLIMGEIPEEWAERRRQHFAEESESAVRAQEDAYFETAEREIRDSRKSGIAPLKPGESITADPALNDLYTGESRTVGVAIER